VSYSKSWSGSHRTCWTCSATSVWSADWRHEWIMHMHTYSGQLRQVSSSDHIQMLCCILLHERLYKKTIQYRAYNVYQQQNIKFILLPWQPSPLDKQRCHFSTFVSAIVLCPATRIALNIGKAVLLGPTFNNYDWKTDTKYLQ